MVHAISKKMKRLEKMRVKMNVYHEKIVNAKSAKEAKRLEKRMMDLVNKSVEVIHSSEE